MVCLSADDADFRSPRELEIPIAQSHVLSGALFFLPSALDAMPQRFVSLVGASLFTPSRGTMHRYGSRHGKTMTQRRSNSLRGSHPPSHRFQQRGQEIVRYGAICSIVLLTGCRSFGSPPLSLGDHGNEATTTAGDESQGTVASVGKAIASPRVKLVSNQKPVEEESSQPVSTNSTELVGKVVEDDSMMAKSKTAMNTVFNFVAGREQEDSDQAQQLFKEGDRLFREATTMSGADRKKKFEKAAKAFRKSGEAAPKSAIEQDALYMQAESQFFADRLTEARDAYQTLQADHPRNRHNDQVAARLFSIGRYWIETEKAGSKSWLPINLTDASRPRLDVDGHAIRVLDQIRYDDPTGKLADDATMAAAAEYIRQEKFEEADEFLTDLRETFTDSEHFFLAHLFGIRTKLQVYKGPRYSGLVLEEADKLVKQTRKRFPQQMAESKYADMVARAASEIAYHRAERLAFRANYREKRKEYGSARFYYHKLLEEYADTPHAEEARKRLAEIETLPAIPEQRLSWLTTIFPESKSSDPLQMNSDVQPDSGDGKTMYR